MSIRLAVAFCLMFAVAFAVSAAQDKDVTLNGKITCAKCDLKTDKECATVIVVKASGKDVVYYLDENNGKTNHSEICKASKEGTVTGKVSEKGGKKYITVTKVDFQK